MSKKIKIDTKNVEKIEKAIAKTLTELYQKNVNWNLAELAVAYFDIVTEIKTNMEKEKKERYVS